METPEITRKEAATIARAASKIIARHGKNPKDPAEVRIANLARHALKAARTINPNVTA